MTYEQTPHGTNRLWLKRSEMPESLTGKAILLSGLDMYSIWGGADKNEEDQMSWEFDSSIKKEVITTALNRAGCKIL